MADLPCTGIIQIDAVGVCPYPYQAAGTCQYRVDNVLLCMVFGQSGKFDLGDKFPVGSVDKHPMLAGPDINGPVFGLRNGVYSSFYFF